jgi:hypothetical protein
VFLILCGLETSAMRQLDPRWAVAATEYKNILSDGFLGLPVRGLGARGGVVVKALRYKPAGRGFDSR